MRYAAVVLRHRFIVHVNEVVEGRDIRARRECWGAPVRAMVVLKRSEAKQDRKKRRHPHPDARHRHIHDWPRRKENNVSIRQVKGDARPQSGDTAPCGFGRGETNQE